MKTSLFQTILYMYEELQVYVFFPDQSGFDFWIG